MSISTRTTSNSSSARALGIARRSRKSPSLIVAMAPPKKSLSQRIGKLGNSLVEALAPERILPPEAQTLLQKVDDQYQAFIHNTVDRLFGEHYQKQLDALAGTTGVAGIPPLVKARNRQAGYAGVAFALVLTGVPVLVVTAFAINLYLGSLLIQIGIRDVWEKRTITARGLGSIFFVAVMFSGYLALLSASLVVRLLIEKFIVTVQGQSHERLANVFGELPQTVSLLYDDTLIVTPLTDVRAGDVVVVHAGEVIPVDGEIIEGFASVDQQALTGEAQPAEMESGDTVFASTMVLMGKIHVRVQQTNTETLAARITDVLNNTRSQYTEMGLRGLEMADKWARISVGTGLLVWPIWGISSTLAVLAIPVGDILMATTPLALMSYLGTSARKNILVKDGRSFDLLSDIDTVVFDKTGTLTLEQPTVCDIHACGDLAEDDLLALAAAIEARQSHPIAAAIREAASEKRLTLPQVDQTRIEVGYGLAVTLNEQRVLLGSQRYVSLNSVAIPADIEQLVKERQAMGHSTVYLAVAGVLQGVIELRPTIRPEAKRIVNALHQRGLTLVMITGDQEIPAQALAETLGIDRVFANVLPQQKAEHVQALQGQGAKVMFIGDGINDSIALKQADVSVSIRGATTVATDTAQVVLMNGTLAQLDQLFTLSEQYGRDMQRLYALGVYAPIAQMGTVLFFGVGLVATYVGGVGLMLLNYTEAIRPAWRQKRLDETKQQSLMQQLSDGY